MAKSLRSNEHKVIGSASSFPENVLPTKSDVVKRTQLSKDHLEFSTGKQKIPVSQILEPVLEELGQLWQKASIPTINESGIEKAVSKLKQDENQRLLDISACKCKQIIKCPLVLLMKNLGNTMVQDGTHLQTGSCANMLQLLVLLENFES